MFVIYMAPEYMQNGDLSTKADVYSLGVMVLEFITGRRVITGILEYVERIWLEGTLSNIIDPRIDVNSSSLTRSFEIGLLCVQVDPLDRPTMEEVVSMLLDSSSLTLPVAKMQATVQATVQETIIRRECLNCITSSYLTLPVGKMEATLQKQNRRVCSIFSDSSSLTIHMQNRATMSSFSQTCPIHDFDTTAVLDFISELRPR
ncbi:putative protein kinase RLK-Pelle-DLSV family [Helianthus annuus]|nr:putative protein kinase RLK-Pelle-DLSV family [Helianthus annuus]KAJ0803801.1 putative protein kinase RLK-Pelle-DLSV family [Helianthus annuus]KAJ0865361.1 putative protein kinase RLK-Pelle-DLSV family [Helianthus annuus]